MGFQPSSLILIKFKWSNLKKKEKIMALSETITNYEIITSIKKGSIAKQPTYTWRKPTNTGVLINFNVFCRQKWKSGLILCLFHRAKLNCFLKNVTY